MTIIKDITGQRFGRLTVLRMLPERDKQGQVLWLVECQCDGKQLPVRGADLRSGHTQSCGCWQEDRTTVHGMYDHELYMTWYKMIDRCENPNNQDYHSYGGRGISVYPPWRKSARKYIDYVTKHLGPRPVGKTADRIENDGNYEPGNLQWATKQQQALNRRRRSTYGLRKRNGHYTLEFMNQHGAKFKYKRSVATQAEAIAIRNAVLKAGQHLLP